MAMSEHSIELITTSRVPQVLNLARQTPYLIIQSSHYSSYNLKAACLK